MSDTPHEQIMFSLGEIKGELKGVNKRLDKLNNGQSKNTDDIVDLQTDRAKITGIVVGVSGVVSIIVALVSNILP